MGNFKVLGTSHQKIPSITVRRLGDFPKTFDSLQLVLSITTKAIYVSGVHGFID